MHLMLLLHVILYISTPVDLKSSNIDSSSSSLLLDSDYCSQQRPLSSKTIVLPKKCSSWQDYCCTDVTNSEQNDTHSSFNNHSIPKLEFRAQTITIPFYALKIFSSLFNRSPNSSNVQLEMKIVKTCRKNILCSEPDCLVNRCSTKWTVEYSRLDGHHFSPWNCHTCVHTNHWRQCEQICAKCSQCIAYDFMMRGVLKGQCRLFYNVTNDNVMMNPQAKSARKIRIRCNGDLQINVAYQDDGELYNLTSNILRDIRNDDDRASLVKYVKIEVPIDTSMTKQNDDMASSHELIKGININESNL
ncbi:unnamed protein product [Didymodactylos carnosus]|uniref:Apple domain-containing protein n=1 Tax=Didymodactylos carnosus TaxID=1234261 RepID=A0A813Q816_9BILA|nr:unnamed protein product [Didymodactylos carnosus]CAF3544314.1 unnamed protein product [Didymodactylos carnosus]